MEIGHHHDFGINWNEVVNNWCLGLLLPVPHEKAWEALEVLEFLWPEYLGEVLSRGQMGAFVMAHVIDNGLTLLACQDLNGFEGVLRRIKNKPLYQKLGLHLWNSIPIPIGNFLPTYWMSLPRLINYPR
ncbi:MAG: hypothetical protein E6I80_16825 [Chloroflexi bacterium]|nr:MAG: hypothetical protein E6I80_16825 [Chloroflexota bacterium]